MDKSTTNLKIREVRVALYSLKQTPKKIPQGIPPTQAKVTITTLPKMALASPPPASPGPLGRAVNSSQLTAAPPLCKT